MIKKLFQHMKWLGILVLISLACVLVPTWLSKDNIARIWLSHVGALAILGTVVLCIAIVPLAIRISRVTVPYLIVFVCMVISWAILFHAIMFLHTSQSNPSHSGPVYLLDALYFSVITWTTVGFGDITPPRAYRLVCAIEAITGMLSIPLLVSLVWYWCERRIGEEDDAIDARVLAEIKETLGSDPPITAESKGKIVSIVVSNIRRELLRPSIRDREQARGHDNFVNEILRGIMDQIKPPTRKELDKLSDKLCDVSDMISPFFEGTRISDHDLLIIASSIVRDSLDLPKVVYYLVTAMHDGTIANLDVESVVSLIRNAPSTGESSESEVRLCETYLAGKRPSLLKREEDSKDVAANSSVPGEGKRDVPS